MIKKIGGWGNFFTLSLFIIIVAYSVIKKYNRVRNPAFVKGVSLGVKNGVRGNFNLYYIFHIGGKKYEGSVPSNICKRCKCCDSGNVVIVRIENGKPSNNDLVEELPDGAWFLDY